MRKTASLLRSTVGIKVLMAVTGLVLFLFVLGHMLGNLKVFQGPEKFNAYAEFLRDMGTPLFGRGQLLWIARVGLLAAVVAHIGAAVRLTRVSHAARPVEYRRLEHEASTYASRTMRWGGLLIAAFVVYHLLHFTFGSVHPDFIVGSVYHNVVVGFKVWPVALAYVVAIGVLGTHLYHGVWSTFQTLGANSPRYNRYRRPLAAVVAAVVFVGFISVPVAVWLGIVE